MIRKRKPIEPKPYFSCRITGLYSVSLCSIKHHDLNRALAHGRQIRHKLADRVLMVEVIGRILKVDP